MYHRKHFSPKRIKIFEVNFEIELFSCVCHGLVKRSERAY